MILMGKDAEHQEVMIVAGNDAWIRTHPQSGIPAYDRDQ